MLKYTRSVIGDTIDAVKRIARTIELIVQFVYIAYLIIAIALGNGILFANIALLTLSVAYLVYDIASAREWYTKLQEKIRDNVKQVVKITKKVIHIVIITIAIIELCTEPFDPVSLIMTFIMIIGFVVSLLFEIIIGVVEDRKELLVNAVALDLKPKKIIDVVHKITRHQPTEEELAEEKMRERLDKIYEEQKEKKQRKKLWKVRIKEKENAKRERAEAKEREEREEPEKVKWK